MDGSEGVRLGLNVAVKGGVNRLKPVSGAELWTRNDSSEGIGGRIVRRGKGWWSWSWTDLA